MLDEIGFTELTPIQAEAIPVLLGGKDLIGQSRTGSGKTLAFGLPILNQLEITRRKVQALVLCPTRELAVQVTRELRRLGRRFPGLNVAGLVGGQPVQSQLGGLRMGAHIVVGTPGRVLDHLKRGSLDLRECRQVVLDEADRMLDMGFQEQMEELLAEVPPDRQTVLFSATFPDSIESISAAYQRDPVRVTIEGEQKAQIEQHLYTLAEEDKLNALLWAIQTYQPEQAIVFCNLKATVVELAACLVDAGVSAAALQGDLEQSERDRVMAQFRNSSLRLLVATDVAARGIDVADLALVVNFDLPKPDIYLHRVGRTGRAGKSGVAISFALPGETYKVKELQAVSTIEKRSPPATEELDAVSAPAAPAKMTTLFIGGGRKDKLRPGDILGALTGDAGGFSGADIGKIEIHDRFSYVAISSRVAEPAMHRLREGKIKGRKFRVELVR